VALDQQGLIKAYQEAKLWLAYLNEIEGPITSNYYYKEALDVAELDLSMAYRYLKGDHDTDKS